MEGKLIAPVRNLWAWVQDGTTQCGVCEAAVCCNPEQLPESPSLQQATFFRQSRGKSIIVLAVASALIIGGSTMIIFPVGLGWATIGLFTMLFGAIHLLAVSGVFSNAPYHGRASRRLNRVDEQEKERERKEYDD